jgi:energy-coupling factor transport system substrate-specific component
MYRKFPGQWLITGRPAWTLPLTISAGAVLNILSCLVSQATASPLFLDSIWTAVCGGFLGPLPGAVCGLATNLLAAVFVPGCASAAWFAPCNMATGFIVGLAARRGWLRQMTGCLSVILTLTLVNSLLGALTAVALFGGMPGHNSDNLVSGLAITLQNLYGAAFLARVPVNLIDKGLSLLALLVLTRLAVKNDAKKNED